MRLSSFIMSKSESDRNQLNNDLKFLDSYPKPLSPPLPLVSKDIELNRAMSASSRSSLFTLKRSDVIFEDKWLIAVNKPSGVYCESVLASAPQIVNESVVDSDEFSESVEFNEETRVTEFQLANRLDRLRNESSFTFVTKLETRVTEFHLANRLDRDTSGVMVITKSHKVAAKLVKAFTDRRVRKTYIALCIGPTPQWEKITLKSGHGRSKFGAWRVYAARDVGKKLPGGSSVRDMETTLEILSINGKRINNINQENYVIVEEKLRNNNNGDELKDEILVRACPRSGRTHQIRLHCQHLGISIRGDVKYEGVYEWKGNSYDGHELHAESLALDHPVTGLPIVFRAPLPIWASEAYIT